MNKKTLSVPECAELLNLHQSTIYKWLRLGLLDCCAATPFGYKRQISFEDVLMMKKRMRHYKKEREQK